MKEVIIHLKSVRMTVPDDWNEERDLKAFMEKINLLGYDLIEDVEEENI